MRVGDSALLLFRGVYDEGDGAVVDQGNLHVGAEAAGGDWAAEGDRAEFAEFFVERDCVVGASGAVPRWTRAFAGAGEEGELADDEEACRRGRRLRVEG